MYRIYQGDCHSASGLGLRNTLTSNLIRQGQLIRRSLLVIGFEAL